MALTEQELNEALRRCEQEPVQQIGHVQPHGATLVLGPQPERLILQASENLASFFPIPFQDTFVQEVIGRPLSTLIGEEQLAELENLILVRNDPQAFGVTRNPVFVSRFPDRSVDLSVFTYNAGPLTVLEVEVTGPPTGDVSCRADTLLCLQSSLWPSTSVDSLERYFDTAAALVRNLTGFGRVMVYRFEPNWDGEVIAEARSDAMPSYLGNRFPASDIPPQARQLYARNLIRSVADIEAAGVAITPAINPMTGSPLDMSYSRLRSFSPIHIEYLKNMGVRASLSISLLQNGRLWGLIACHDPAPRQVTQEAFDNLEFLGRMISMWLTALEARDQEIFGARLSELLAELMKKLSNELIDQSDMEALLGKMLQLLSACGVVLINAGQRMAFGEVPTEKELDGLLHWLEQQPAAESIQTNHLSSVYPAAEAYPEIAAGLLVCPFQKGIQDCALWFRPEKTKLVKWAGSPEKTVVRDREQGLKISPRQSFTNWSEVWRQRSEFWAPNDLTLAETLSHAFTLALTRKDQVTGLPSRSYFNDRVHQAISRATRNRTELMLIFIDLDGFKQINDTLGHHVGDEVLKEVAHRLRASLRAEDTVVRWGGDEYSLLLEDLSDAEDYRAFLERIRESLLKPVLVGMSPCRVSGSIGVARYPQDANGFDDLFNKADAAMYQAKHKGGNRVVAWWEQGGELQSTCSMAE